MQPLAYATYGLCIPGPDRHRNSVCTNRKLCMHATNLMLIFMAEGRVKVESDHQPLEAIMKKPLNDAPKSLQRMLLQLQKYSLHVSYKKGWTCGDVQP